MFSVTEPNALFSTEKHAEKTAPSPMAAANGHSVRDLAAMDDSDHGTLLVTIYFVGSRFDLGEGGDLCRIRTETHFVARAVHRGRVRSERRHP